jgi:uncharacterized linocin/CFP29 family protein
MNDLRRDLAPITGDAWEAIDDEARRTLTTYLAGRKLVDFNGPEGWTKAAVGTGRARRLDRSPGEGVEARVREVMPLVELRVAFDLEREELDAIPRGTPNPDLGPVIDAARRLALAEDRIIFDGYEAAGIRGILGQARKIAVGDDILRATSEALEALREAGVGGPHAVALSPRWYTELAKIPGPGRYPLMEHLRRLVEGPVVWAPALAGGVVVSTRGDDFQLTVGRDISIGYLSHDAAKVRLYLEESLTFRVWTPEAAVALTA